MRHYQYDSRGERDMYIQHFEQTHEIPVTIKLHTSKLRNRRLTHVGKTTTTSQAREYERDEPDVV